MICACNPPARPILTLRIATSSRRRQSQLVWGFEFFACRDRGPKGFGGFRRSSNSASPLRPVPLWVWPGTQSTPSTQVIVAARPELTSVRSKMAESHCLERPQQNIFCSGLEWFPRFFPLYFGFRTPVFSHFSLHKVVCLDCGYDNMLVPWRPRGRWAISRVRRPTGGQLSWLPTKLLLDFRSNNSTDGESTESINSKT